MNGNKVVYYDPSATTVSIPRHVNANNSMILQSYRVLSRETLENGNDVLLAHTTKQKWKKIKQKSCAGCFLLFGQNQTPWAVGQSDGLDRRALTSWTWSTPCCTGKWPKRRHPVRCTCFWPAPNKQIKPPCVFILHVESTTGKQKTHKIETVIICNSITATTTISRNHFTNIFLAYSTSYTRL